MVAACFGLVVEGIVGLCLLGVRLLPVRTVKLSSDGHGAFQARGRFFCLFAGQGLLTGFFFV